jgi:hypothetical protein
MATGYRLPAAAGNDTLPSCDYLAASNKRRVFIDDNYRASVIRPPPILQSGAGSMPSAWLIAKARER